MLINGPSYQPLRRRSWEDFFGARNVVVFFSTKAVRSGPKVMLQFAICLIAVFCLTRLLFPHRVAEVVDYAKIWDWKTPSSTASAQGGLRIVVFGEADIATPPRSNDTVAKSWTEKLCDELACSTYLSFVPTGERQTRSLVSNTLYDIALSGLLTSTHGSTEPGLDYTFLEQNYSVPYNYPDLRTQVLKFLAMPAPKVPPSETLWVFSFGTWDVWHLAGFPRETGQSAIRELARYMFTQIEVLYSEAQKQGSIAYSQSPQPSGNETENSEKFGIILPRLFDPSLAPGWRSRPTPPRPHTNAEHLRNAAYLTMYWNTEVTLQANSWTLTDELSKGGNKTGKQDITATGPEGINGQESHNKKDKEVKTAVDSKKRGPLRDAYLTDVNSILVSAIIDAQLRYSGNEDHTPGSQLGSLPVEDSFDDSTNVCVPYTETASGEIVSDSADDTCSRYLFVSDFSVSSRAVDNIVDNALGILLNDQSVRTEWEANNNARTGQRPGSKQYPGSANRLGAKVFGS